MTPIESDLEVRLEPREPANAAVIWLHGLGADGHDFVPIVPELGLPAGHRIRFIFPHAEVRPVTLNGGMAMRAWYDIATLDRNGAVDDAGIAASRLRLQRRITWASRRSGAPIPWRIRSASSRSPRLAGGSPSVWRRCEPWGDGLSAHRSRV